jgi:hypothetical protein
MQLSFLLLSFCLSFVLQMFCCRACLQLAWWGVAFWGVIFYTAFGGKKKEAPAEQAAPAAAH